MRVASAGRFGHLMGIFRPLRRGRKDPWVTALGHTGEDSRPRGAGHDRSGEIHDSKAAPNDVPICRGPRARPLVNLAVTLIAAAIVLVALAMTLVVRRHRSCRRPPAARRIEPAGPPVPAVTRGSEGGDFYTPAFIMDPGHCFRLCRDPATGTAHACPGPVEGSGEFRGPPGQPGPGGGMQRAHDRPRELAVQDRRGMSRPVPGREHLWTPDRVSTHEPPCETAS